MTKVHIYKNGSVYSPAAPFATSMLTNAASVEWVGADAGAASIADNTMQKHDLDGLLITPGFVAGGVKATSEAELTALTQKLLPRGYVAATVFMPAADVASCTGIVETFPLSVYAQVNTTPQVDLVSDSAHGIAVDPLGESAAELVAHAVNISTLKVSLPAPTSAAIDAALELIETINAQDPLKRLKAGFRLDGITTIDKEQLERAEKLNINLGFTADIGATHASLAESISRGISTFIGSNPHQSCERWGWELISDAIHRTQTEHNISARAAFNALTRGAWRALGYAEPTQGQLVPGGNADFAMWEAPSLMVQTADDRVAAWSTDPRARTPLLPELDGTVFPLCYQTVIGGHPRFSAK